MKGCVQVAQWRGIPIYAGWNVLLILPILAFAGHTPLGAVLALPGYALLVLVHEIGHAWVVRKVGAEPVAIELHCLGGLCHYRDVYSALDDALIAWGGVAAQFILLSIAAPVAWLLGFAPPVVSMLLMPAFTVLTVINVAMIALNLLPVKPLDGYKAWQILWHGWHWISTRGSLRLRNKIKSWRKRKSRARPHPVPSVQPDMRQQMRDFPDEASTPEAAAAAAELLRRLKQ